MDHPVILSGCRTPTGTLLGNLSSLSATHLGALAMGEAVRRSGLFHDQIDEVILGNVLSAGLGQAPVRKATIFRWVDRYQKKDEGAQ